MFTAKEYKQAESLEQAYELNQKRSSRILGGMLWLKMSRASYGTVIDLSGLGLDTIEEDVLKTYEVLKKNQYGKYLKDVLDGRYVDKIHDIWN